MSIRLAPTVVQAANPSQMTLDGTRTFIVGRREPVVIDPGPDDPEHIRAIVARLGGAAPVAILLTHLHPDHAGGAAELSGRTGAPVMAGAGAISAPEAIPVSRSLAEGDQFPTDDGSLRVLPTPGHSPEHLAFIWAAPRGRSGSAAFVGDLLMGQGETTLISPPEGDLAEYLRSLDRLEALRPDVLYPAHGPPIPDPPTAISRYREHRRERLRQVRRALDARPRASPEELAGMIYGADLHPALRDAAVGSVAAMLQYLASAATD